jgi:hypothetical protein
VAAWFTALGTAAARFGRLTCFASSAAPRRQAADFPPIPPAACYANEDFIDSPKWNRNEREIQ